MDNGLITQVLVAVFGALSITIFGGILSKLSKLTDSVEKLNTNMGIALTRLEHQERGMGTMETRVAALEASRRRRRS